MEKYLKVLELMKSKGGKLDVADADLSALIGKNNLYRIAVYMSYIRRLAKLEVLTIRNGRTAIRYELVVANPDVTDDSRWQNSKYVTTTEESPGVPPTVTV